MQRLPEQNSCSTPVWDPACVCTLAEAIARDAWEKVRRKENTSTAGLTALEVYRLQSGCFLRDTRDMQIIWHWPPFFWTEAYTRCGGRFNAIKCEKQGTSKHRDTSDVRCLYSQSCRHNTAKFQGWAYGDSYTTRPKQAYSTRGAPK